jgi:hypothetical protein
MKNYKEILKANEILIVTLEKESTVTFNEKGISYIGVPASQIWSEATVLKLKTPEVLQLLDEMGYLGDFCIKCFRPVNEDDELCRTCRTQEAMEGLEE